MSRVLPILFNTEMVRAILDGRKTVTRRLVKPQLPYRCPECMHIHNEFIYDEVAQNVYCARCGELLYNAGIPYKPPYQPGDILYVRETFCSAYDEEKYFYLADKNTTREERRLLDYNNVKWCSSIHMPKEAARIWLKVLSVRVERLQDIDDEQAKAEGANWKNGKNVGWEEKMRRSAVERFAEIWDSTIKKSDIDRYGWDANPWVWRIEFERCEKPEGV